MTILDSELYVEDLKKVCGSIDLETLNDCSVLVTGGLGLICASVVDLIIIYNRFFNGHIKIILGARNKATFDERYGSYYDCIDYFEYNAELPLRIEIKPDYIIHGAGVASPDMYTKAPVETMMTNINGVSELLKYSRENAVKRLLYISSSEVYGIKNTVDSFKEGQYGIVDIDSIRSSYPIAKKASEMICKAYTAEYGVDTVIVRPGHVYGPTAKENDKRVSSDFAYKAANGENIVLKSPGLQKRSYCYSLDCAVQILTALLKGKSGESYNIGHDEVTTIREMAEIIAKAGDINLKVAKPTEKETITFNPMDNSSLDNKKIKDLGYKDSFTVEEGLTHTVLILKDIL